MKRRKQHLKVKRADKGAGLGLYTEKEITKGDYIIEYTGEKITEEEGDRRGGRYLFTVSKTHLLDAKDRKHTARYINHSCRPNCYAELDEDAERVFIYAKRNIKAGEELTYHYGKGYWEDFMGPRKCRCEKCKERRSEERKRKRK